MAPSGVDFGGRPRPARGPPGSFGGSIFGTMLNLFLTLPEPIAASFWDFPGFVSRALGPAVLPNFGRTWQRRRRNIKRVRVAPRPRVGWASSAVHCPALAFRVEALCVGAHRRRIVGQIGRLGACGQSRRGVCQREAVTVAGRAVASQPDAGLAAGVAGLTRKSVALYAGAGGVHPTGFAFVVQEVPLVAAGARLSVK